MRTLAVLMFDDVEVLDVCGPFEVFSVANRITTELGAGPAFEVVLVGIDGHPVRARGGMRISVDATIDDPRRYDVVMVPGGVVDSIAANAEVLSWVQTRSAAAEVTASVCTGVFVLASAGVLDQRPVTTHWEDIDELRSAWPELDVRTDVRYLDHGDLATSAGISAGLDLSLRLVARLVSAEVAALTARKMQYDGAQVASGRENS